MNLHVSAELAGSAAPPPGASVSRRQNPEPGCRCPAQPPGRGGAGARGQWSPVSLPGPCGGGGLGLRSRAGGDRQEDDVTAEEPGRKRCFILPPKGSRGPRHTGCLCRAGLGRGQGMVRFRVRAFPQRGFGSSSSESQGEAGMGGLMALRVESASSL